jgi:hypothetical protein
MQECRVSRELAEQKEKEQEQRSRSIRAAATRTRSGRAVDACPGRTHQGGTAAEQPLEIQGGIGRLRLTGRWQIARETHGSADLSCEAISGC